MDKPGLPRAYVYSLIMTYVSCVVIAVGAVLYANYVDRNSNRQWCDLVVPLDQAYTSQVPTTELGRTVARAIHRIRDSFEC
jgi:hypothetical protein